MFGERTITAGFLRTVAAHGELIALRGPDLANASRAWSFREYAREVACVAGGLLALGVEPGDCVVLVMRNRPAFHILDLATLFCGASTVSLYTSSPPTQLAYLLGHSRAKIAVVEDAELLVHLQRASARLSVQAQLLTLSRSGTLWEADPIDLDAARASVAASTLATISYTASRTGPPSGVMLTHDNVVATAAAHLELLGSGSAAVRVVSYLPMAHISVRMSSHYLGALGGFEISTCADPSLLADRLRTVRPHYLFGVPGMWERLHEDVQATLGGNPGLRRSFERSLARDDRTAFEALRRRLGLEQLIIAVTGVAPMRPELLRWYRAIGVPLCEQYGIPEATGALTWQSYEDDAEDGGRPFPGCDVFLSSGGEVCCRGANVFAGYLDDSPRTGRVLGADGTLRTGDVGELDRHGLVRVVESRDWTLEALTSPAESAPGRTALDDLVLADIIRRGPLPFSDVVEMALYDPDHGFYAGAGGHAGHRGDFVTSPELGPLFGAVIARALDSWWDAAGRPDPWVVAEVGAGPGTLARTILAAGPRCSRVLRYVLVERSATQRAGHARHLPLAEPLSAGAPAGTAGPIVVSIGALPGSPDPWVVIAHELLDNLPFDLAERTEHGWSEVRVGLGPGGTLAEQGVPLDAVRTELLEQLAPRAAHGARVALQGAAAAWLRAVLGQTRPAGRVIAFDYATTTAAMAVRRQAEWLRTYRRQASGAPPLVRLGHQDITCEVAVDQLADVRALEQDRSQTEWLRAHGLGELATETGRTDEASALTDPRGVGAFRVLEWLR